MESKTLSWLLVGASRGLGAEFAAVLKRQQPSAQITVVSRKAPALQDAKWLQADISKASEQDRVIEHVQQNEFENVVYFAGGGPYGPLQNREWKDHQWALEVTFLFAARLTHALLKQSSPPKSLTFIGSSVAESAGDAGASSYSAAKWALKGFFESLILEQSAIELRLFSPGYMDTGLLPRAAFPREKTIWNPKLVAEDLFEFLMTSRPGSRRQLTPYPP